MHRRLFSLILLSLFLVCGAVQAQTPTETKEDQTNLETQLYMIVGTNQDVADPKIPAVIEPVIKQLRATLPYKNYRLAAVLINRVKNDGKLEVGSIGVPIAIIPDAPQAVSRSSYRIRQVKLTTDSDGKFIVQLSGFTFSAQVPVSVTGPVASNNPAPPAFIYEGMNLSTDLSMREGEPVLVGTLNVGPAGDTLILVTSAKRTAK
jgi:hypothetical protein